MCFSHKNPASFNIEQKTWHSSFIPQPYTGLIQPELLADGQVCVDMGTPVLNGPSVPTTLQPTQGSTVVAVPLEVMGVQYSITAVSMGNPHAVVYSAGGAPVKVGRSQGQLQVL